MDDIRRHDRQLFFSELVSPMRLFGTLAILVCSYALLSHSATVGPMFMVWAVTLIVYGMLSYTASEKRRFTNKRMESLWNGCQDRMKRFEEVLKRMRRDQLTELREMPATIRGVSEAIYAALRRADLVATEVDATEQGMFNRPPTWEAGTRDAQSRELYRIADKNIAEYRTHFAGVMAGVQRTEAQSAVFMTTLDTLRMKLIGYRLVGRSPELSSQEFLEAIAEARAQLQAIDTALEELDLGHYPKQISVVPPPVPEEIAQRLRPGG